MVWHEGYHHGQIKLALKAMGRPLDDERLDGWRGIFGLIRPGAGELVSYLRVGGIVEERSHPSFARMGHPAPCLLYSVSATASGTLRALYQYFHERVKI
jgi:hypothetical protein